jgi:hypothetical protein
MTMTSVGSTVIRTLRTGAAFVKIRGHGIVV